MLSPDERIHNLWQYWLPQAIVKALQLAPNDPDLKQAIVEELRARHYSQVILLRQEGFTWEYLFDVRLGRKYANPFMMDDERKQFLRRAHILNLKHQRKELAPYVTEQLRIRSEQSAVRNGTGQDHPSGLRTPADE